LPDTLKDTGEDSFDPRRSELRLCSKAEGGFRLEAPGRWWLETAALGDARHEIASSDPREWTLRSTSGPDASAVVLEVAGPEGIREVARSERRAGTGLEPLAFYLSDGRVFFAASGNGSEASYELHGWEVRGAYWTAARQGAHWTLSPTAAGRRLRGSEALLVLFAAEIIATECSNED
jgi:hypothetical protein